jgi:osmotically-inducible protein OsmY
MLHASCLPAHLAHVTRPVLTTLACLLAVSAGVGRLHAADFNPRDVQQEILVREALANDPRLQPLNLVVRVNDRVATLSGPVPSRELARRALDTARKVTELRGVQDKMMVQFEDAGLLLPLALKTSPAMPPAIGKPSTNVPTMTPDPNNPSALLTGVWIPVNPQPPQRPTIGVALLPWTSTQPGATGAVSLAKEPPTTNPAGLNDAAAASNAVHNLLQGQERFRRLRFEIRQGKVYLSGRVYRWSDLQDLAQAITQIPGIEGVVLSDVKTEPPR